MTILHPMFFSSILNLKHFKSIKNIVVKDYSGKQLNKSKEKRRTIQRY